MGEVGELVTGISPRLMTLLFVTGTLLLQVLVPYHRYVFFLKWLTLSLLAYAAVLFSVHVPWHEVALRTVWPTFTPNAQAATMVVAVFGTTISFNRGDTIGCYNCHSGVTEGDPNPATPPTVANVSTDTTNEKSCRNSMRMSP